MSRKPKTKTASPKAEQPGKSPGEIEGERALAILRPVINQFCAVIREQTDTLKVLADRQAFINSEIAEIAEDIAELRRQAEEVGIENILRRKSA